MRIFLKTKRTDTNTFRMDNNWIILLLRIFTTVYLVGRIPCTTSGGDHTLPLSKLLHLTVPPSHTALSGDLHIQVSGTWPQATSITNLFSPNFTSTKSSLKSNLFLRLSRLDGDVTHILFTMEARPDARTTKLVQEEGGSVSGANVNKTLSSVTSGTTVFKLPCGLFSRGGAYYVELMRGVVEGNETDERDEDKLAKGLDVRWPLPRLSLTPEHVQTYPESPVTAILEFPEVLCPPVSDSAPSAIPEFWLELHYCGHSLLTCDNGNKSTSPQILYSEQIRGFPGRRIVTLRCELFGLAGHYSLVLRPTLPMPSLSNTAAYVKADWSEQFVFNVHARSILPCDVHAGGVTVLFQYPSCILASGDRVRLYARLRADVASLAPPTSMVYVAEKRVVRGQHSLHFECDLFSERFVEYCFVYVSQAITGAVADVRMDCVPTLPVSEAESGGWGTWSAWTACSSTCSGGTRNRYRFCDSPPPRYGAKFCEGLAVETEKCGGSNDASVDSTWECLYGTGSSGGTDDVAPADRPEILAEVGPGCRCGCVVHLGQAKPRRLLATSSHSCPGRTFWLIQADAEFGVRFKVDHYRLPCASQWLKVRDGSSLSATLLAQLSGGEERRSASVASAVVQSSGPHLLLEFFSDELMAGGEMCGGGFLAHALQIRLSTNISSLSHPPLVSAAAAAAPVGVATATRLTAVHIAALLLASIVLVATALLAAQYVLRYRKYHIAEDMDSLADSNASLALRARASSSATLLSEVISLTRLRPPGTSRHRHTRLRESMDYGEAEHEAGVDGEDLSTRSNQDGHGSRRSGCIEEDSFSSTMTLTPTERAITPIVKKIPLAAPEKDSTSNSRSESPSPSASVSPAPSVQSDTNSAPPGVGPCANRSAGPPLSVAPSGASTPLVRHRHQRALGSNAILANVSVLRTRSDPGCYSPATSLISTATIRSTNPKESKEKRNRERLLAGPVGSEFSLAGPDADLELDYYDYNVVNAGAVPGSYLGMDPQYLVWIPPLDDAGEILQNLEKYPYEYEDIRPKQFVDPGSNQESPEEEVLVPKIRRRSDSEGNPKLSPVLVKKLSIRQSSIPREAVAESPERIKGKELIPVVKRVNSFKCSIPLSEFPKRLGVNSPAKVHKPSEKETKVEKSPSVKSYDLDDIKFADDEVDDDNTTIQNLEATNKVPYQDSNIISSKSS